MLAWLRDLTARERKTMLACWGGWTLDGFDKQLYSYVVPTVIAAWGMSTGAAGTIGAAKAATMTAAMSAALILSMCPPSHIALAPLHDAPSYWTSGRLCV